MMARESLVVSTLVELADNLVDDYDVIDVLTVLSDRCVETIDVDAAGVMLAWPGGELQFVASSSESMRVLELFQIQADEGPCVDSYNSGQPIVNHILDVDDGRWPRFTPKAIEHGFVAVNCIPLRLRGRTIGALNLFRSHQGELDGEDIAVAKGFADVATIAILQHQSSMNANTLNEQLNNALNSRIIIEQAKGMIRQATDCDMDEAFDRMRGHARNHNEGLTEVAVSIVVGGFAPSNLDELKPKKR
jgi:GAF domain-containing protein